MKKFRILLLAAILVLSIGSTALAAGGTWFQNDNGWWYVNADGSSPAGEWAKIDGKWYHFDRNGYMQTGWLKQNGHWYFLRSSGAMATGWVKVQGSWYYLGSNGVMVTGWKKIQGEWYCFDQTGRMYADYYVNNRYYVDRNGRWNGIELEDQQTGLDTMKDAVVKNNTLWVTMQLVNKGLYVSRLKIVDNEDKNKIYYTKSCALGEKAEVSFDDYKYGKHSYTVYLQIWNFGWRDQLNQTCVISSKGNPGYVITSGGNLLKCTWKWAAYKK